MVVYEVDSTEGFEWINAINPEDYETFARFDGKPRMATWKPIKVKRVRPDKRSGFKRSDFPWLGRHALVMRRTAVDALRDILNTSGELLPLSTKDGTELFVLNAQTINALDLASSSLTLYPGTQRIMLFNRVAFFPSKIEGIDLFRLPDRGSPTYVSAHFVEAVNAAGLLGLDFKRVWASVCHS